MKLEMYPEMIPLREAAERTKDKEGRGGLSYDILRKWCLSNKIVHIRVGKKFLVNWGKLCDYLENAGIEG